jgi:hypothetical protein
MLQAPKRIRRCALTGAPLVSDSLKLAVAEAPMKRRKPGYLETVADAGAIAAPLTLHRHETEGVGLAYAVMMSQYLRYAVDTQTHAERLALIAWWQSDYGINRVRMGLLKRLPEASVKHALEVVLTCHREQADPADIAERFQHSEHWVRAKIDWCMHIAQFHRERCGCLTCQNRRRA